MKLASKQPATDRSLWIPLWIIMASVGGWGLYHTIGALRSGENWQLALLKAAIILGCVSGFLVFWALALRSRSRRQRSQAK